MRPSSARSRSVRAAGVAVVVAVAAAASAGCGEDDGAEGAVPAVDGSVFTDGTFDDIPIFRGATPMQELTHEQGTTTGSYEVETARPETVLRFYEDNLAALGWEPVDRVRETSDGVWRGDWLRDGRRLQIIASPLSRDSGDATHAQLDIVLLEGASDITVATPPPL